MAPVDDDVLMLGHRDAKLDLKKVSTPVTGLRPVHDDATTGNSRTEFFQTLHLRSDLGSDLIRWLAIAKGDFDWGLHIKSSRIAAPPKKNKTPLTARRLAADELPHDAPACET